MCNKVIKIKATGTVAWGVCIGALGIAIGTMIVQAATTPIDFATLGASAAFKGFVATSSGAVAATTLGSATTTAISIGVAGGGIALLNAAPAVKALLDETTGDEKTGVAIVLKGLEAPIRQIAANAGLEGSIIINAIQESGKIGYGYDFAKDVYCDMASAGILDPTKVTRSALQNASSVASMVLTTESLVTDKPDPAADAAQAAAMAAAAQGGGMY